MPEHKFRIYLLLKQFFSQEWSVSVSRFSWFCLAFVLIVTAPVWAAIGLLNYIGMPAKDALVERSGVVESLVPINPKAGGGTSIRFLTNAEKSSFRIPPFCRAFSVEVVSGQSLTVLLERDGNKAWQVRQGDRLICSYEQVKDAIVSNISRLCTFMVNQILFGMGLMLVALFRWHFGAIASGKIGEQKQLRRKKNGRRRLPWR